jgi:hypothetical protein
MEKAAARATASKRSGGSSIGPAFCSPRTSTPTVPALMRNTNSEPPTIAEANDSRKAASTMGRDISDPTIVAASSRQSSDIRAPGSAPSTSATRRMPPTSGTASRILNSESATA